MSLKQKNFVSAVVYICNSENVIEGFLKTLYGVFDENFEKFEIICVNDASFDNGKEIIKNLAGEFKNCMISVINMSYYQGVETAMHAGVDLAIGDFVFEFDKTAADYEPGLIMRVYGRSLEGYDIVSCGSGHPGALSKLFYSVYNRHSGAQYNVKSETFRVISRRAVNRVHSMSTNLPYRKAMYAGCGLKTDYIHYKSEKTARQKRALKNPYETAVTTLVLFTDVAYKITLVFTGIMMLAALGTAGYVVTVYLTGSPVAGYTTTMFFMSAAFFALFAVLAVIIKYLSVIVGLVFNKQKYAVESVEKITG